MKKDITIPKVKGVEVAAILEFDQKTKTELWTVYLINQNSFDLETVLVVSEGQLAEQKTSLLRKKIDRLPRQSYAKIEFLQDDILNFENSFKVTYFSEGKLYHKDFIFRPKSISKKNTTRLKLIDKQGVLSK